MNGDVLRTRRAELTARHEKLLAEHERLTAQIELLDELLAVPVPAEVAPAKESPAPKAAPRPEPATGGGEGKPSGEKPSANPHKPLPFADVGRILLSLPKATQSQLADLLQCHPQKVRATLEHHNLFFRRVEPTNVRSPWELTDEGRRELAG